MPAPDVSRPPLRRVVGCEGFDDAVAEFALGLLDADHGDALAAHASGCERCRSELDSMVGVADRLVLLAPHAEPPVGFESSVISTLGGRHRRRRPRVPRWVAAAVLIVAMLAVSTTLALHSLTASDPRVAALDQVGATTVRSGHLIDGGGHDHGTVLVTAGTSATLTMHLLGVDHGVYHCLVVGPDGKRSEVAAWPVGGNGQGTWAVAMSTSTASAHQVMITEDDGSVVATAILR